MNQEAAVYTSVDRHRALPSSRRRGGHRWLGDGVYRPDSLVTEASSKLDNAELYHTKREHVCRLHCLAARQSHKDPSV
ncbi:unnamed protein product [Protopolystoma xenopodis]|uniref:Uncharacterized protein n=1 Tax=Protopolystoma xenopodis TaxID=117903 RepID=A0A448WGS7_9PLAT|nr:unnamed protein product [Protopolystoma xenopodis]